MNTLFGNNIIILKNRSNDILFLHHAAQELRNGICHCTRIDKLHSPFCARHSILLFGAEFLHLNTTDIFHQVILCCRRLSCDCRMFSSIHGFYPLDTSNTWPPHKQKRLQILSNFLRGQNSSRLRTSGLEITDNVTVHLKPNEATVKCFKAWGTASRIPTWLPGKTF